MAILDSENFIRQYENERPILKSYTENNQDKDEFYCSAQGMITIMYVMIEFAKLHVQEALKQASEKAKASAYYSSDNDGTYDASVNKNSILNAYSLDNIK